MTAESGTAESEAERVASGIGPTAGWSLAAAIWATDRGLTMIGWGRVRPIGGGTSTSGRSSPGLGIAGGESLGRSGSFMRLGAVALAAQVASSLAWPGLEGGIPTAGSVRWPAAIAGLLTGFLLTAGCFARSGRGQRAARALLVRLRR